MVILKRSSELTTEMSAASDSVQLVRLFNKNHEDFYKKWKETNPSISPRVSELLIRDIIKDLKENKYPNHKDTMKSLIALMLPQLKRKDQKELSGEVDSLSSNVPSKTKNTPVDSNKPNTNITIATNSRLNYEFFTEYIPVSVGNNKYCICLKFYARYVESHRDQFYWDKYGDIYYPIKQTPDQIAKMLDDQITSIYKNNPSVKEELEGKTIGVYLTLNSKNAEVVVDTEDRFWNNFTIREYTRELISGEVAVTDSLVNGKYTLSVNSIRFKVLSSEVDESVIKGMVQELNSMIKSRYNSTPDVEYKKTQSNPPIYRLEASLWFSDKAYGNGREEDYRYTYTPKSGSKGKVFELSRAIQSDEYNSYDIKPSPKEKDPLKFSKGTENVQYINLYIHKEWD